MKKTLLYINNEYCTSLEQLKGYFARPLVPGSSLYNELLTLQSDRLLADWLFEGTSEGEKLLARELDKIPDGLSDSALMARLKQVLIGSKAGVIKPNPLKFLKLEAVECKTVDYKDVALSRYGQHDYQGNINLISKGNYDIVAAEVSFKFTFRVLKKVNEQYRVILRDGDETDYPMDNLSLNDHRIDTNVSVSSSWISVPKPGKTFELRVDDKKWMTVKLLVAGN